MSVGEGENSVHREREGKARTRAQLLWFLIQVLGGHRSMLTTLRNADLFAQLDERTARK